VISDSTMLTGVREGVFALTYGVVADIASPAERGGFVGIVSFW
jgi:hypothetical protein